MVSNKLEKESHFAETKNGRPWSSFMFPNGRNIKWTQLQSKHGICLKLGAMGKYFQFISMNKSIANWNYLLQELSKDLSSNPHQLPTKVVLIQRIGFSTPKKKKNHHKKIFITFTPSSFSFSSLFDNEQIFISQKIKNK